MVKGKILSQLLKIFCSVFRTLLTFGLLHLSYPIANKRAVNRRGVTYFIGIISYNIFAKILVCRFFNQSYATATKAGAGHSGSCYIGIGFTVFGYRIQFNTANLV